MEMDTEMVGATTNNSHNKQKPSKRRLFLWFYCNKTRFFRTKNLINAAQHIFLYLNALYPTEKSITKNL
jgi:phosphorylcholine metabolism protein LicD